MVNLLIVHSKDRFFRHLLVTLLCVASFVALKGFEKITPHDVIIIMLGRA